MSKGQLVIISGFSGVGKGTVVKKIIEKYDDCVVSVSATTRDPRPGEKEGVHYFYKTREEFKQMIEDDKFLEYAEFVGNLYGTPKDFVEKSIEEGKNVILEIEVQGTLKVKEEAPDAKLIFVLPPSAEALKDRLVGRGSESTEVIRQRLLRAAEETEFMDYYDYYVVNGVVEDCAKDIKDIIDDNFNNKLDESFIKKIKEDIKAFSKGV